MIYIYLHGFNSAYDPNAEKIQLLSTIGEVMGINYNSFGTYEEIFNEISTQVPEDRDEIVFVGTSLGGFWAAEMGRRFAVPSVIINPCYDPYVMLRKYVGDNLTNYVSGETKMLTNETVETYLSSISGEDTTFALLPLVLLDMGDEVIDSFETRENLTGFPIVHWADGSHRFEHMNDALQHIKQYANHCSYVDQME